MPMLPMVNDMYWQQDQSHFTAVEKAQGPTNKVFTELWFDDYNAVKNNPLVFPNKASAEQVKKMPKAIVLTTEFDSLRKPAEEAAELYKEHGKLLELGVLKGCHHGHFVDYNLKATDPWFAAIARVAKIYL